MPPIADRILRNRWFATCAHVGLWVLLFLAVANLGRRVPELQDADATPPPPQSSVPIEGLENLFSPGGWSTSLNTTNQLDSFSTRHFIPPTAPPPTTRKILVTYLGFYQAGDSPSHTMFKLGDAYQVAPPGTQIATNLFIAKATMEALTLTNLTGQTNILPLNAKKELEVPIR